MEIPLLLPENKDEFLLRLSKVRRAMEPYGVEALLVASTTNIYYLSGCVFRGYIYITADRDPLFFIMPPGDASGYDKVYDIHKPELIPDRLADLGYPLPKSIGLGFNELFYSEVTRLACIFPEAEIRDGSKVMASARLTKTEREIEKIREDGRHQAQAYSRVPKVYRPGMTDLEFQIEMERVLRLEGCLGYLRVAGSRMELNMGSVIAGENADNPSPYDFSMGGAGVDPSLPVGADGGILRPGTTLMVDMNGGFNGYQSDMTRTWRIGSVSDLAFKAHECSRRILRRLEEMARPGVAANALYDAAVEISRAEGLEDYFMGHRNKAKFIGHSIGIDLNEAPVIMGRNRQPLEENMTIALEPKFVIPHVGAVGVENTYRVALSGLENLTVFPEELNEL